MSSKSIGPTFADEIALAGLRILPFSWGADGVIEYGPGMTPNQISAVEAVYAAHDPTKPDPSVASADLLTAGLVITSTGTPAVNGTYACDNAQQSVITRLQTYIAKNGAFPGALTAVQLRLASGATISIPSIAVFQEIATAIADFVAKVDEAELAALAGGTWSAPAATATIA